MARRLTVTIGAIYGRWTVLAHAGYNHHHHLEVDARCTCGRVCRVELSTLVHGRSSACQSCAGIEHGHCTGYTASPEYWIWHGMKKRCHKPDDPKYAYYGGRGIHVCSEWRESFTAFLTAVGPRPAAHLTLERIDNDGDYEPGNVKWATRLEQQSNRRSSRYRTLDGHLISLSAMARHLATPRSTLESRLRT